MDEFAKYYGQNDMFSGINLKNAEKIIISFDPQTDCKDINQIIQLFNIQLYFDNNMFLKEWDKQTIVNYSKIIENFKGCIGKFFSKITSKELIELYKNVSHIYKQDFWKLINKYKFYKQIEAEDLKKFITEHPGALRCILECDKMVRNFDEDITEVLVSHPQYAEIVLDVYATRSDKCLMYLPKTLDKTKIKDMLKEYIAWADANVNYLQLISHFKSCNNLETNDRIRYEASKRCRAFWNNISHDKSNNLISYGAEISFTDLKTSASPIEISSADNIIKISYDINWINNNLDYPTLLNNFIHLFGYVDGQSRCTFISNPSKMGVIEKVFGIKGNKDYITGIDYNYSDMISSTQMHGYIEQLENNGIYIEDIFKWFFEVYLSEEFGVKNFSYFAPSKNASTIEKIMLLVPQFDGINKQFNIYIENGYMDRDFFEFSSDAYKLSSTGSLLNKKYIYIDSPIIQKAVYLMFSDQSLLYYDKDEKFKSLPDMLRHKKTKISEFVDYNKHDLEYLIDNGFIYVENDYVTLDEYKTCIMNDLYNNEVILYQRYERLGSRYFSQLQDWIELGYLKNENTLFTRQEQEYLDYMLNVQRFNNGPELRDKYAHGIIPTNEHTLMKDYIKLLKIMTLLIIKINDEFCFKYPQ